MISFLKPLSSLSCLPGERSEPIKQRGYGSDYFAGADGHRRPVLPVLGGDGRSPWVILCNCFDHCRALLVGCFLWWHIRATRCLWRLADSGLTFVSLNQLGGDQLQKFHKRWRVLGTWKGGRPALLWQGDGPSTSAAFAAAPERSAQLHTISGHWSLASGHRPTAAVSVDPQCGRFVQRNLGLALQRLHFTHHRSEKKEVSERNSFIKLVLGDKLILSVMFSQALTICSHGGGIWVDT